MTFLPIASTIAKAHFAAYDNTEEVVMATIDVTKEMYDELDELYTAISMDSSGVYLKYCTSLYIMLSMLRIKDGA